MLERPTIEMILEARGNYLNVCHRVYCDLVLDRPELGIEEVLKLGKAVQSKTENDYIRKRDRDRSA